MITAIAIAAALLANGQNAKAAPGALVSTMLSRYYSATSASGKLTLSQSANGKVLHGETVVQIERPNHIFVRQSVDGEALVSRIVCDGQRFAYSLPKDSQNFVERVGSGAQDAGLLVEDVVQFDPKSGQNKAIDLGQIYNIGRSGLLLRPEPLDLAVAVLQDLKTFKDQLVTVEDLGEKTIGGQTVRVVGGDWRQYVEAPVSGRYQLSISKDGDLVRYSKTEMIAGPPNTPSIEVTTTWDVDLKLNSKIDQNYFRLTK